MAVRTANGFRLAGGREIGGDSNRAAVCGFSRAENVGDARQMLTIANAAKGVAAQTVAASAAGDKVAKDTLKATPLMVSAWARPSVQNSILKKAEFMQAEDVRAAATAQKSSAANLRNFFELATADAMQQGATQRAIDDMAEGFNLLLRVVGSSSNKDMLDAFTALDFNDISSKERAAQAVADQTRLIEEDAMRRIADAENQARLSDREAAELRERMREIIDNSVANERMMNDDIRALTDLYAAARAETSASDERHKQILEINERLRREIADMKRMTDQLDTLPELLEFQRPPEDIIAEIQALRDWKSAVLFFAEDKADADLNQYLIRRELLQIKEVGTETTAEQAEEAGTSSGAVVVASNRTPAEVERDDIIQNIAAAWSAGTDQDTINALVARLAQANEHVLDEQAATKTTTPLLTADELQAFAEASNAPSDDQTRLISLLISEDPSKAQPVPLRKTARVGHQGSSYFSKDIPSRIWKVRDDKLIFEMRRPETDETARFVVSQNLLDYLQLTDAFAKTNLSLRKNLASEAAITRYSQYSAADARTLQEILEQARAWKGRTAGLTKIQNAAQPFLDHKLRGVIFADRNPNSLQTTEQMGSGLKKTMRKKTPAADFVYGRYRVLREPLKAFNQLIVRHHSGYPLTKLFGKYKTGGHEDTRRIASALDRGIAVTDALSWLIQYSAENAPAARSENQKRKDEKRARATIDGLERQELAIYEFLLYREREESFDEDRVSDRLTSKIADKQKMYYASDKDSANRLEVLLGMKKAGNASQELVAEASQILNMFEKRRVITAKQAQIVMNEMIRRV